MNKKTKKFINQLQRHTKRKAKLYDGINKNMSVNKALRLATEELGEIATAITRDRWSTAKDECIDLAHCAMLINFAIDLTKNKDA